MAFMATSEVWFVDGEKSEYPTAIMEDRLRMIMQIGHMIANRTLCYIIISSSFILLLWMNTCRQTYGAGWNKGSSLSHVSPRQQRTESNQ